MQRPRDKLWQCFLCCSTSPGLMFRLRKKERSKQEDGMYGPSGNPNSQLSLNTLIQTLQTKPTCRWVENRSRPRNICFEKKNTDFFWFFWTIFQNLKKKKSKKKHFFFEPKNRCFYFFLNFSKIVKKKECFFQIFQILKIGVFFKTNNMSVLLGRLRFSTQISCPF